MKFDKNSVQSLLRKWAQKLIGRIRSASLLSRITGGAFALSLLLLLTVPFHAKPLFRLTTVIAAFLWAMSLLFNTVKRLRDGKMPSRNPFTLPLIAAFLAFVLLLTVGNTPPAYDESQEPMSQMILKLTATAALPQEEAAEELKIIPQYFKSHPQFNYNIILLDKNGRMVYDHTRWLTGSSRTVYPLFSHSPYSTVGMMVLLSENEQVLGAFEVDPRNTDNSSLALPPNALTLAPISDTSEKKPDKLDELHALYFPSFGEAIDEYALQLAVRLDRMVVETDAPYQGELSNRPYEYDYAMTFLNWKGEKIVSLNHVYQGKNLNHTAEELIDALNALSNEEREALQSHVRWLENAWSSAHNNWGQCVQVFENAAASYKIMLLYNNNPNVLYPSQTVNADIQFSRRMMVDYAMLLFLPLSWILLAFWVFADAKKRGHEHPALWGILTMIGSVITLIIYHMVRPKMRVDKEGRKQPKGLCPLCGAVIKDDYIACPGCGVPIRCTCPSCGHALENDWNFCPYCSRQLTQPVLEGEVESEAMPVESDDSALQAEEVSQAQPAQAPTDAMSPEPEETIEKDAAQADGSFEA